MQESQLMQIFQCLTRQDRRNLRSFVRSPFHNTREDVVRLYEYLDNSMDSAERNMNKESIFDAVFNAHTEGATKVSFDAKKLNYTCSFLDKVIRDYLIINQLQNDSWDSDFLLQKAFILRGQFKLATKVLTTAQQTLESQQIQNASAHYHSFKLHHALYDLNSSRERTDDTSLQESADTFTAFAVAEVLRQGCSMLTQQAFSKRNYNLPLLEVALKIASDTIREDSFGKGRGSVACKAYYHAYQSLSNEGDTVTQKFHFQELRHILETEWQQFPAAEMHGLYVMAINFCIKKMNRGEQPYEREVLEIYKIGLTNRLLFENNQLSPYTYKNTMMAALKVGEMDWAKAFLDEYKPFLPPQDRDMIYKYNKALYFFRINDYTAAMILLQTVNLREVLFNLDTRRLLARIYFELNEWTALDSLIESSKIYLHRQKGIGYHREMYLNFFKILEMLLKADPKKRLLLSGMIAETKYLAERVWLLEKLDL
ncbi:MAG: hypothetical protein JNL70_01670 [Saprospiraceae bacterium]|nr:hypothetical protein [Saprospiraceae bacterium]